MIYFSSDLHLNHRNIIKYCGRPFDDEKCMDKVLFSEFQKLTKDDTLFLLGDLSLNALPRVQWFLEGLSCTKVLIKGNHDLECVTKSSLWDAVFSIYSLEYEGLTFHMKHHPWTNNEIQSVDPLGAIFLHGHVHGSTPIKGKRNLIDVGVDAWDYKPASIKQIIELSGMSSSREHLSL